jgi:purine-binding chemotaxis protein CheW
LGRRRPITRATETRAKEEIPLATAQLSQQLVVFSLGEEEYALPITQVQEIIRYSDPRAVAADDPWIRGVISLRGKIVPVCDLAARLGLAVDRPASAKIVIVEAAGGTAGVIVDEVEEVLTVEAEQLEDVPAASADVIEAIAKIGDRLVVLLDPDRIFGGAGRVA